MANCGSRTEIQDRCCQGLSASRASHRRMVDAEAARLDKVEWTALELFRLSLSPEIAQTKANSSLDLFADEANELV